MGLRQFKGGASQVFYKLSPQGIWAVNEPVVCYRDRDESGVWIWKRRLRLSLCALPAYWFFWQESLIFSQRRLLDLGPDNRMSREEGWKRRSVWLAGDGIKEKVKVTSAGLILRCGGEWEFNLEKRGKRWQSVLSIWDF